MTSDSAIGAIADQPTDAIRDGADHGRRDGQPEAPARRYDEHSEQASCDRPRVGHADCDELG
ncbi:hypothetical protein [Rhodococcoides yunnanense]|uniref:hypothetical protein n=1 Tax=Rhodococcoides yunnanense TaxID=278209 RepID=UPI0022B0A33D|nr:hypothetical protein [Rhodococcus yunnanensis]MCZ4278311.1 hypothetical protein [Rhodococcus yunnanensis]